MLRFALFGAGRIGAMHAANIAANPGAELAWVFDVNKNAAETVAGKHGAKAAASAEAVLSDKSVDAVLIASSTDTHVPLITASALAGKAILCEKPIDLDIKKVEQCREDIAKTNVPVQIGFNRRYDATHRAVRQAVAQGEIGTLELLTITSRDPELAPVAYLKGSGGIFRDMTIHDFDLARFILGEDPAEIQASGSVNVDPAVASLNDYDTVMVTMKAKSGALVHINNSRRCVYGYDQRVEAFGSKGMVQSENPLPNMLKRSDAGATQSSGVLHHFFIQRYMQAYLDELNEFIDRVSKGLPPTVDFEDGRKALIIADAAFESVRTGKTVKMSY
jgi:myo-inositol 2-dehydrogenase/D-chiro-inositol 1-dehydrogenase